MTTVYTRPELTAAYKRSILKLAVKLSVVRGRAQMLVRLLEENAMLTAEVNEHRKARGFDLLPTYENEEN